jgi:hypothetical protein
MPPNRVLSPEFLTDTDRVPADPKPAGGWSIRPPVTGDSGRSFAPPPHGGLKVWRIARALVVILLLIFSGLYFWGASLNQADEENLRSAPSLSTEGETKRL